FAKSNDLEIDSRLVLDLPESRDPVSSFEAGYKLTEDLVKQKRPFTALMAFDDLTAFGAIRALAKSGLRVPEHCSVIGFDDVAASALYTPALTTIRQPMEVMGTIAVSTALDGVNAVLEKRQVSAVHRKIAPELAVRESTRRLA
ncbi:MAG: substrate-binding domain-containing protein, partial [Terriglobales bacterium]